MHRAHKYAVGACPSDKQQPAAGQLGIALRTVREAANLSQFDLATRAGVGQSAVSRLERDVHRPSWALFCRLLAALDLEATVTTRPRGSALDAELERLSRLTSAERWTTQGLPLTTLRSCLPSSGWALDGNAALLGYGIPVKVERLTLLLRDDDEALAQVLDGFVRNRCVEVLGATTREGTRAFPVAKCAAVMRQIEVSIGDGEVPVVPLDCVQADTDEAAGALARWAKRLT